MSYIRVSPGIWRDQATGKTIRSATDPNKSQPKKKEEPKNKPSGEKKQEKADKNLIQNQTQTANTATTVANTILGNVGQYQPEQVSQQYQLPVIDQNYIQQYQDNAYAALTRGLEDRYGQEREQMMQTLANRGIPIGSELYNNQMGQLDQRYDEQRLQARNQSYAGGLDAANTYAGIGNTTHQTAMEDYNNRFRIPTEVASTLIGTGGNVVGQTDTRKANKAALGNAMAIAKLGYGGRGPSGGGGGGEKPDDGLNFV